MSKKRVAMSTLGSELQGRRHRESAARSFLVRAVDIGVERSSAAVDVKRTRVCNFIALYGAIIMGAWALIEAMVGDRHTLPWEVAFLASFLAVLTLNAAHTRRAARLLLIVTANACVLAGAVMFERSAGGTLTFFALVGLPLMLFGPTEIGMLAVGAVLPVLLFVACETGVAARWLAVALRPAAPWYFWANAATAFGAVFLITLFFFRSNLRAEALVDQIGRQKLKRLIDSSLIGVVRGTIFGRVEEANTAFLEMLGYSAQDLSSGAIVWPKVSPLDPEDPERAHAMARLRQAGVSPVIERTLLRKDGTQLPALVGAALLDESEDEVVAFVLDLSARKAMEAQKAMLWEREEALRRRDLFDSIASHELRTPLTVLTLGLQMLRRGLERHSPTSTLKVQAERCESSATRMRELVQTLLDVAQIHDGRLKLSPRDVDVVDAVARTVSTLEASNLCALHQIQVHAEERVTARLDALRFEQVLTNLLSNGLKYGGGQPVEVRVSEDRSHDMARLEVIDHGPGIPAEKLEGIFRPFERAVAPGERIPGLGLGLYVVKMIVDSHGGSINVDSQPGRGSRFVVEFPRQAQTAPPPP
jgi:PAS domain S-box-containing protein